MNPSRETKFSGTNEDREYIIFPVQLDHTRFFSAESADHIIS